MASLFKNPLQALMGQDNSPNNGPLASTETAKSNPSTITYENVSGEDPRWVHTGSSIDASRWNKNFPYQLMILERIGGSYAMTHDVFTLPIPPTDMTISTPFAISTAVTLGGIVEEHNGAPLRMINFNGTTGVTPLRGSAQGAGQKSVVTGIFAGTVSAISRTVANVKTFVGAGPPLNLMDESDEALKGTGYYQFRLLQKFLESYVTLKKQGKSKLRLGLAIWKDQAVYLVTPVDFTVRRSAQSPWEYLYSLSFKAWGRITLGIPGPDHNDAFKPVSRDPNAFAQVLNKISDGRRILQGAADVLGAVNADIQKLLYEPLREVTLFCKDAIGLAATAADFPDSIWNSLKGAVIQATDDYAELGADIEALGVKSGKAESKDGDTDTSNDALNGAEPGNGLFNGRGDFDLRDKILPSELNLSPALQASISAEKERVRSMSRLDFEKIRDQLNEFQVQFSDAIGAGSDSYNATYGRSTSASTRVPTPDDFEALFALNQVILELNRLAASSTIGQPTPTTVDAVAGMASAAGIAFTTPVSKLAVPFPYGSSLEQLSAQYLGDPNRWHEIAALNGLRQPFVDEEGFELPLLVNGNGNQISVADARQLFVGQPVTVSSNNTSRTSRRITAIDRVAADMAILTLNGDPDLDRFTTLAQASLHAYLPDTVNSQQLIYIPSQLESDAEEFFTKSIPGVDEFDQLIAAGGMDLLLTQNGDLAVTPDGDCRLATGLTNLIQRIRIALGTPRGSLLHHPDYGLGLVVGASTADLDAHQMLATLEDMFKNDPAFSGVSGVSILKTGPAIRVAMSVGIAGTNQTIPLTVDIRR